MRQVTASEAAGWCEGVLYGPDISITRQWRSDSREATEGDAFVAIKGTKTDGHLYLRSVVERGASLLLIDIDEVDNASLAADNFKNVTVIAVNDVTRALARIAQKYLDSVSPRVVGITGSVGKTTTRELAVSVLRSKYKVHSAIRSFNTVLGCSLTILAMPEDTEVLVLELGTNHFGEISEMVSLFSPETVLITEVAPAHLEGFGSVEGVLNAKVEICSSPRLKDIIFNNDNVLLKEYMLNNLPGFNKISVGKSKSSKIIIEKSVIDFTEKEAVIKTDINIEEKTHKFSASLFGNQHAYNIAYAAAIGRCCGVSEEEASVALSSLSPIAGRGVCTKLKNDVWIIDESYNANPTSMGAAIDNVLSISHGDYKMFAVLGGMRELGSTSPEWHQKILDKIKSFEKVVLLGEEWYDNKLVLPCCALRYLSFEEMLHDIPKAYDRNSIVLIKGSNSYGLKKIVAMLTEDINV